MTGIDYEVEYNNRARVPEHPAIIDGWARDAAAYRQAAGGRLAKVPYGGSDRQVIDLFEAEAAGGTVMLIHGGYWQALDPSFFSHLARGLNAHAIAVAIAGYDLCPTVQVADIVDQMRAACRALASRGPLVVAGHSAGGHLAACMLATDWKDHGARASLVPAAYAISGLFDLKPLVSTSVNDALRLTEPEAACLSPLFWTPPTGRALDAVVGAEESAEYLRQSRTVAETWGAAGVATRFEAFAGANHFTVVAPLADPASAMTARLVEMLRSAR